MRYVLQARCAVREGLEHGQKEVVWKLISAEFVLTDTSRTHWERKLSMDKLGIAWDAAASVVNQYRNGRFMVPKKVLEAKTSRGSDRDGLKTDMIVLFQESWCSPQDGNSLADICESMCPLFYGGAQAKYRIINYQNFHGENTVHATKLEDVKPRRRRNAEVHYQ
ncbi:hypothetical protein Y032_0764g2147 [Ancylostoma ceylanicum]|nr:hypothetical protein Y032_0764g2147 [Ancylostoma ceylanicum]